jgi:1-acyl-sn-glycerol-3-phosphate acyltransferase
MAGKSRKKPEPVRSWTWPHYRMLQFSLPRLMRLMGGFDVYGQEHVPATGGAIIAANHTSHMDPPAMCAALHRRTYYFAKKELFDVPVLGWIIRKSYAFPVDREGTDRVAIRNAVRILKAGELLTLFPEGERSLGGAVQPGRPGVAFIAKQAGVPIIPCALKGVDQMLPRGGWYLHRGRVAVSFGAPIQVSSFLEQNAEKSALNAAVEAVMASIQHMRAELYERAGETPPEALHATEA